MSARLLRNPHIPCPDIRVSMLNMVPGQVFRWRTVDLLDSSIFAEVPQLEFLPEPKKPKGCKRPSTLYKEMMRSFSKKQDQEASSAQLTEQAHGMWDKLTEQEQQSWVLVAAGDKQRYDTEMAHYNQSKSDLNMDPPILVEILRQQPALDIHNSITRL